jgi:hypothetical protein
MRYRGWTIQAHATYLGYSAQYTSPIGHSGQTSAGFATDQQAISYAQALVDQLLRCEPLGIPEEKVASGCAAV